MVADCGIGLIIDQLFLCVVTFHHTPAVAIAMR